MKKGDIVRRKDGQNLRSGASAYGAAIVIQTEPLVLVSEHADMRWESTIQDKDFEVVGEVTEDHLQRCMARL